MSAPVATAAAAPEPEAVGLTREQAARFIGVSARTLDRLLQRDPAIAKARRFPSARPVFVRSILEAWLRDPRGGCATRPPIAAQARRSA